jgi:hypothetical protein
VCAGHSPLSSAEVKNGWSWTYTSLYAFKACTGTASLFLPVFTQENSSISATNEKSISDGLLRVIVTVLLWSQPEPVYAMPSWGGLKQMVGFLCYKGVKCDVLCLWSLK